jgi:hypothetical protein
MPARPLQKAIIAIVATVALAAGTTAIVTNNDSSRGQTPPTYSGQLATYESSTLPPTSVSNGTFTRTSERAVSGSYSAKATACCGGYARAQFTESWAPGTEIWYGGTYYLPPGFLNATGYFDLVRWDNFSLYGSPGGDVGGIEAFSSDTTARLSRDHYGGGAHSDLVTGIPLPEGRWFRLDVHQRLSTTSPLSEVYEDGKLIGRSTQSNSFGRTITRIRYGVVALGSQPQSTTVYTDDDYAGSTQLGGGGTTGPSGPTGPTGCP